MPSGPWSTHEERLLDDTLRRAMNPSAAVEVDGPALRQMFPPRFGYGNKDQRTPTIESALGAGRWFPDRRINFSGGEGAFTATSTPMLANPF